MTEVQALLEDLAAAGAVVRLDGERLRFRAPVGAVGPDLRARARAARDDLVHALRDESNGGLPARLLAWPEEWRASFEERAAIMQFDGELPPEVAERQAEILVRAEHARARAATGEGP